jgi:hypothetical protein
MALHDKYARRTPFELAFPDTARAEALAAASLEEAGARGVDAHDPQMFATLGSVGVFLSELRGPDTPPEAVHQYAALAFHGVHFVRAGFPLYLLGSAATRRLVAEAPRHEPRPPRPAGYLQLPQHMVWVEGDDERGVPESADGMFWTVAPSGLLHVLLVTGLRPDRAGVGVVSLLPAPLAEAERWASAEMRGEGEGADFASSIPGASLDGLYGVRTAGEPLKLLARFFALAGSDPHSVVAHDPPSVVGPEGPAPSSFPFKRMVVDG